MLRNYWKIAHKVNTSNTIAAEYSYDAWGRRRKPSDWSYDLTNEPDLVAGRGFTGHEDLPWFNLINMNGRLYDPQVGRFLSVDNKVQDPSCTQSYNSYSYCLNNPLKYADPDGYTRYIEDYPHPNPGYYGNPNDEASGGFVTEKQDAFFAMEWYKASNFIDGPGEGDNGNGEGGVYYDYRSGTFRSTETLEEVDPGTASKIAASYGTTFNLTNLDEQRKTKVVNEIFQTIDAIYNPERYAQYLYDKSLIASIGDGNHGYALSVVNGVAALGYGVKIDIGFVCDGKGNISGYFTFGKAYGYGLAGGIFGVSILSKGLTLNNFSGYSAGVIGS